MEGNTRNTGCTRMKVYVRVRPFNPGEEQGELRNIVKVLDDQVLIFDPKQSDQPFFFHGVKQRMRDITKKQNKEIQFIFDRVYDSISTNQDVYDGSAKDLIASLLDGYNCSVFVYGATGAGKTFTMLGSRFGPGITYLTLAELYNQMEKSQESKKFELRISFLEVYNENVHDLLNPSSGALHLREDTVNGVTVAGMLLQEVTSAEHLYELLHKGNQNRTQHPTDANAESSRSHAVLQVYIKMQNKDSKQIKIVKLSMIDLAGSERGAATNCSGMRFKEGSNINKSLLALGNCINNLADGVRHIPYRDSKLTRLLKDSLGGNCQTVMIACVAPTTLSYEDTYNTLRYATRAMNIKTKLTKNVVSLNTHVQQYKDTIRELQSKITLLQKGPNLEELLAWEEKIHTLYQEKIALHREFLTLESKEKISRWRAKEKHKNVEMLNSYNNKSDDENLDRLESRLNSKSDYLQDRMSSVWDEMMKNYQKIVDLKGEISQNQFTSLYSKKVIACEELEVKNVESMAQLEHEHRILEMSTLREKSLQSLSVNLFTHYQHCYSLLHGYNKVTSAMNSNHKALQSLYKGGWRVTWEESPSNDLKRCTEALKSYTSLSVDALRTRENPVLKTINPNIIIPPYDEPDDEGENSQEDITFVVEKEPTNSVPFANLAPLTNSNAITKTGSKANVRTPITSRYRYNQNKSDKKIVPKGKENKLITTTYKRPVLPACQSTGFGSGVATKTKGKPLVRSNMAI